MMKRALVVSLLVAATSLAQSIELEVRATQDGQAVADLEKQDFTVKERGKAQKVEEFRYVPTDGGEEPNWLYIALQAPPQDWPRVERAVKRFLDEKVPPGMQVSLGGTSFTDDKDELLKAFKVKQQVKAGASGEDDPDSDLPPLWQVDNRYRMQGRVAISRYRELVSYLGTRPGRKAVVLLR
ncbi:MAG: hypothetical protein GY953_52370, partial [bacterium]|nr:hypothetical protein [bacterium]